MCDTFIKLPIEIVTCDLYQLLLQLLDVYYSKCFDLSFTNLLLWLTVKYVIISATGGYLTFLGISCLYNIITNNKSANLKPRSEH